MYKVLSTLREMGTLSNNSITYLNALECRHTLRSSAAAGTKKTR